ncbi:ATP-binding cassette domain-containing protein [Ensifer canadensis]
MPYLELSTLRKAYGSHVAIKDISLSVEEGEAVAFLGSSGCGKTTTLRMIAGLASLDSGQIKLGGARHHAPTHSSAKFGLCLSILCPLSSP